MANIEMPCETDDRLLAACAWGTPDVASNPERRDLQRAIRGSAASELWLQSVTK
jgi:hypothetical protein